MNNIPLFDKFTEQARKVVSLAQEEVRQFQHDAIGTEHLLLGLVREGEGSAAGVLEELGITLEKVRRAVEEMKGRGDSVVQGEIGLTPHANRAIEMAIQEADRRHPQTKYPLLGTTLLPESKAVEMLHDAKIPPRLEELGVTLEKVREAVEAAKRRGNNMVQLQIETGMAPYAHRPESGEWHHPLIHIETRHLLLGLLRVPEGAATKILQDLGAPSLKDVRTLVFLQETTTLQTGNQGYVQRFTGQARRAWRLAHEEARRLQDSYIGAQHLLLGLLSEGSSVAARVLTEMGVSLEKMRADVKNTSVGGGEGLAPDDIKLQPYLWNIIELTSNEARRLNHRSISTGHLLLVLTHSREGQGAEVGLLQSQGVDLDTMRTAIGRALATNAGTDGPETETAELSGEEGLYASYASIASIERGLQSRELDKTLLAVYPFTVEARFALEDARIMTRQLAHRAVGPEHLLLGLARLTFKADGPVSKVLKELGIDFAGVFAAVESRRGQDAKPEPVVLAQSALCNACLLLAADEAEGRDGQGAAIKSEHLLLGLLREEKGIIAELLGDLGTSVEAVRTKLLDAIGDAGSEATDGA